MAKKTKKPEKTFNKRYAFGFIALAAALLVAFQFQHSYRNVLSASIGPGDGGSSAYTCSSSNHSGTCPSAQSCQYDSSLNTYICKAYCSYWLLDFRVRDYVSNSKYRTIDYQCQDGKKASAGTVKDGATITSWINQAVQFCKKTSTCKPKY